MDGHARAQTVRHELVSTSEGVRAVFVGPPENFATGDARRAPPALFALQNALGGPSDVINVLPSPLPDTQAHHKGGGTPPLTTRPAKRRADRARTTTIRCSRQTPTPSRCRLPIPPLAASAPSLILSSLLHTYLPSSLAGTRHGTRERSTARLAPAAILERAFRFQLCCTTHPPASGRLAGCLLAGCR